MRAMSLVVTWSTSSPIGYSAIAVKHSQYVYADAGNGVYKLCHELTMADGLKYLVDTRTGEVM